jgi:hypothetical protein
VVDRRWRNSDICLKLDDNWSNRRAKRRRGGGGPRWLVPVLVMLTLVAVVYNLGSNLGTKGQVAATTAEDAARGPKVVPFATVGDEGLVLMLPADPSEVLGIGYHQAYNTGALSLVPRGTLLEPVGGSVVELADGRPASFLMSSRGRGSSLTSSVDVALNSGAAFRSPVSGEILDVKPYLLYGRIDDYQIDILAQGHPGFKITIVHLDRPAVTAGQRVEAGITELGVVRSLGIDSQIDQYLGKPVAHIHIQANPLGKQRGL